MNGIEKIKDTQICALSSFGHNGLDWIHSLIDNHPEVLIMPAFSFYRTLDLFELKHGYRVENFGSIEKNIEDLSNFFYYDKYFKTVRRRFLEDEYHFSDFKHNLLFFIQNSKIYNNTKNIFLGIHYAFSKIYNIDFEEKKVIIFQEHIPWHSAQIREDLNAKFIFMMRDPRAGLAGAWKRTGENRGLVSQYPLEFDKTILWGTYSSHFCLSGSSEREISEDVKIMVNEDMHIDLEYQMRNLCDWLSIKYCDSCLDQTFLGIEWLGESTYLAADELSERPPEDFYDIKNVERRWRSRLSSSDISMIEVIFSKIFRRFSYKTDTRFSFIKYFSAMARFMFIYISNEPIKDKLHFLRISRNLLRRTFVIFFPSLAAKFFKII